MPVTVRQHAFSPDIADGFKSPTASTLWYARGSDDEAEVITAALSTIPETFYNLVIKNINYKNRGGGFWDIEAKYEVPDYVELENGLGADNSTGQPASLASPIDPDAAVGPEFSADTTGATEHLTQSIATQLAKHATDPDGGPFTATDHKGAIGVSKDGIAGCDVFRGKIEFSLTLKAPDMSWGYIELMADLTGKTNDAPFLIFEVGEVLYLGGTPNYRGGEGWSVTHKFAVQRNSVEIVISDALTLKAADRGGDFCKLGWEYLWVEYATIEDGGTLAQQPVAAYVEQVYESADLSQLGFGAPAV